MFHLRSCFIWVLLPLSIFAHAPSRAPPPPPSHHPSPPPSHHPSPPSHAPPRAPPHSPPPPSHPPPHSPPPRSPSSPPSPTPIPCPAGPLIRSAGQPGHQSLSPNEQSYISTRASKVLPQAWLTYLTNVHTSSPPAKLPNCVSKVLSPSSSSSSSSSSSGLFPKLGIALSGGSYRAALFDAAALSALDARNKTAAGKTGTGGLLQAATYLSGLSGGSWTVTSLAQANFPTIADLTFPPPPHASSAGAGAGNAAYGGWIASVDLTQPSQDLNTTLAYLETLVTEVAPKFKAGFPITITDVWGRAISRHFVNGTTPLDILQEGVHGAGVLFSDIANVPTFVAHEQPFPIIVADSIPPNLNPSQMLPGESVPLTSEIWEFNVFESGSFDPSLASFIPTSLLGSSDSSHCFAGFDQAGYISGISSNLFNQFNTSEAALDASPVAPVLELIQAAFGPQTVRLDSAAVPNPFKGVNPKTYSNAEQEFVTLIDGGSNGEAIPLQPLLVRARGVDTIIAIDASADTADNWTNGTELIATSKRAALFGSTYPFPPIPSTPDIFIQQNLTRRPTFFGCDEVDTPLVVYIANGGPPAGGGAPVTNTSTDQTTYSDAEVRAFLDQAFEIVTQGIKGINVDWGTCLACAVVDRARARAPVRIERDAECGACFEHYCWSGKG